MEWNGNEIEIEIDTRKHNNPFVTAERCLTVTTRTTHF